MGSGELIQTLMRVDLIDEYMLVIHPRVLGAGRRLFPGGGAPASLRLVSSSAVTTGALITVYNPATEGRREPRDRRRDAIAADGEPDHAGRPRCLGPDVVQLTCRWSCRIGGQDSGRQARSPSRA
jgi:hypothetical protein